MRKRTAKQEERQEEEVLYRYILDYDFTVSENGKKEHYLNKMELSEKLAHKRKDRLFRIYEKASLEGRLINFERIAILKERIKPFQTIV